MRILHVAMGMPEFDRAAVDRGHYISRLNWREFQEVNTSILMRVSTFKPNVVFFQLQTPNVVKHETLETLRKEGIFTVNWTGDVREDIQWYRDAAPYFGVTLFTNQTDVDTLTSEGLRADFLQIGYDDTIYRYEERKRSGVVFMGNDYSNRFPESATRRRIVEHYRQKGLKSYGKGFGHRVTLASEEVLIYQKASYALNIDHFNRPRFYSDRVLRAQACGAIICQMSDVKMEDHPFALYGYPKGQEMPPSYHKMVAEYTRDNHTWRNRIDDLQKIVERWAK